MRPLDRPRPITVVRAGRRLTGSRPTGLTIDRAPLPRVPLAVLGVLSITSFGGWFYGYGVLLEDLTADTGWSETVASSAYGVSLLLTGIGAMVVGRLLDRTGSRRVFLGAAVLSVGALVVAAGASDPLVFGAAATLGGGVTGAAGFYQATQAVMARLVPDQRARGITVLTLWGAFASPVALPLMGWAVSEVGWRTTLRGTAIVIGCSFLAAALLVPDVRPDLPERPAGTREALRRGWHTPPVRRLFLAGAAAGIGSSILLLSQVPAMVDAGLALTLASTLAGVRGFLQLLGRIPLPAVIERMGAGSALRWAYALTAVSAVLLLGAGNLVVAGGFTLVAGVAIGALAAAEGIYAAEVVDEETLGTQLGVQSLLRGLGAAVGPVAAGVLVDATGSRVTALLFAAVASGVAAAALTRDGRPGRTRTVDRDEPTGEQTSADGERGRV
jgi:MFS family permease